MSEIPPDGVVPPEEVKEALDHAMTSTPGMLRTVVKEALQRGEAEDSAQPPSAIVSVATPSGQPITIPDSPPKPRRFKMQTIVHRIELPNPGMAEELRAQMAQAEVDSVLFVDGKWIYIRQRAIAVEETDAISEGKEGDGVAKPGERPVPQAGGPILGSGPAPRADGNQPTDVPGADPDNGGSGSPPNHP